MRFARTAFLIAGIWGLLCLPPMYFLRDQIAAASGPITYPEHFYGFVGTALVWQLVFLLIWREPLRYRPLMALAVLEKLAFGLPVAVLFVVGQVSLPVLVFGAIDLALGALFVVSFLLVRQEAPA